MHSTKSIANVCESVLTEEVDPSIVYYFYDKLSTEVIINSLSKLFFMNMSSDMRVSVPNYFLNYTAMVMVNLKSNGRTNVIYNLSKDKG